MTNRVKEFTAEDICRIIETAGAAGVAKLKFGDVEMDFSPKVADLGAVAMPSLSNEVYSPIASPASEQTLSIDDKIKTVDEELLEDMRVAQLMLEDPLAYEQEMIDAHLAGGVFSAQVQN